MRSQRIQQERTEGNLATPTIAAGSRFTLKLLSGVFALAFLWILFSQFVVPPIIKSAYRGESLAFLNGFISGQGVHPVEHYLMAWKTISWRILGMLIVIWLITLPLVLTGSGVQRYLEGAYGQAVTLRALRTNTILAFTGLALVFYLYYLQPVGYVYFIAEDYWAEYATFVSWGMACWFLTWMLFNYPDLRKPGFILLALASFLVAMEEISWGQRILSVPLPSLFAQYNLQGETTIHNLVYISGKHYVFAGITTFLWSIPFSFISSRKGGWLHGSCTKLGIPIVPIHLWPFFLLASFSLIYAPFLGTGEVGELFLALAFAVLSLDLFITVRRATGVRGSRTTVATAGMILVALTAFLVQVSSSTEMLRDKLNRFALVHFPSRHMYGNAEMVIDYMNEHPQFLTPETHIRHGMLLVEMGEHAKARRILEIALAEQKKYQEERPGDSWPYRNAGQVLKMLGRPEEAEAEFLRALERDRSQLEQAVDAKVEARVRWSLAETLFASGDSVAALEQALVARAIADGRTQLLIDKWIQGIEALAAR